MATYDVAFGTLQRATHRNTSWEVAKFEVCAHKFVDRTSLGLSNVSDVNQLRHSAITVSDNFGYGCALLSESKYGYAVEGQTIRLSLLRAPTAPDPDADQGQHNFSFGIYPHEGTFAQSDVADVAYAFNTPMTCKWRKGCVYSPRLTGIVRRLVRHMHRGGKDCSVEFPFVVEGAPNVRLETVKHAEDGNSIILRAHEHMGGKAKASFRIR